MNLARHMMEDRLALPAPILEWHDGFMVVRDDLLAGGTKLRAMPALFEAMPAEEYVYASPAYGYAQVALALAGSAARRKVTILTAARQHPHPLTAQAEAAGANIVYVGPAGYMSVCRARAQDYAREHGARLLPFGLDHHLFIAALADMAARIEYKPREVWAAAGSGCLIRALKWAWPAASCNAVVVGADPNGGTARLHMAPEKFEQAAREPPPFPSCPNYDAKVWRIMRRCASPGALFWNVAA